MKIPTLNVVLKNKLDRFGRKPVIINVTFQRKVLPMQTGFKSLPKEFSKRNWLKGDNSPYKNRIIRDMIQELERKFLKEVEKSPLTAEKVKYIVRSDKGKQMDIIEVMKLVINVYNGKISKSTFKSWNAAVNKFNDFKPNVEINAITHSDLIQFENYLIGLSNADNTIWGTYKAMRSILNKAVRHNIIDKNPMDGYTQPGYKQTKKTYLQKYEIRLIEDFADKKGNNISLRKVAAYFIFSCRSGFRYADIAKWNEQEFVHGNRLYFSDEKEQTPHFIPIYKQLEVAIERLRQYDGIPTDQKCNMYLKNIAELIEIPKHITMHVGRHSFAVNFLDHGGDIKVLQKLMGHKKLATTEIYGQITDRRIEDESRKVFDSF